MAWHGMAWLHASTSQSRRRRGGAAHAFLGSRCPGVASRAASSARACARRAGADFPSPCGPRRQVHSRPRHAGGLRLSARSARAERGGGRQGLPRKCAGQELQRCLPCRYRRLHEHSRAEQGGWQIGWRWTRRNPDRSATTLNASHASADASAASLGSARLGAGTIGTVRQHRPATRQCRR